MRNIHWKKLIPCLAVPLAVGGISAFLTMDSMERFAQLNQPPLSPPGWLFPVVWTILYLMMGVACYRVLASGKPVGKALVIYGVQLAFNFLWSLIFFNMELYLLALVWLAALWGLILVTVILFRRIDRTAGLLLLPYLAWVTFAAYLNGGVWLLN